MKKYVILLPVSDEADEAVILQLAEVYYETESYISVDNALTLQAVFEIFKERAKDTFNFVDDIQHKMRWLNGYMA